MLTIYHDPCSSSWTSSKRTYDKSLDYENKRKILDLTECLFLRKFLKFSFQQEVLLIYNIVFNPSLNF